MTRLEVPSYPVSIFIAGNVWEAETICRNYCDQIGYCVTVTQTNYIYKDGEEAGVIVGLINYPRFPKSPEGIWSHALDIATYLCAGLKQQSYTIQAPDKTLWISHREEDTPAATSTRG